ncbi:MAG: glycosyltransferase family 39 protein [Paraprevotella sp.]|nr:glycosyltransferase family 39 protein [Paraprevotella sp.]
MYKKKYFWLLAALCFVTLFLFLGLTLFNTKGEPREAVVALSMLQQGNWILPVNDGVELAFKPPFFHWCVATISILVGMVNEYTSRMPSALALTAMVLAGYVFYAKRRGSEVALLAALLTLTNFEVHRTGVACRVDMVLTALMVIALYQLYKWGEKGLKGVPVWAIFCLSAAFLTKGPVGVVLPCLVPALFLWIRGMRFARIFFSFLGVAVVSCILPALWYGAAYHQGGDHFLRLVMEENVYRFLGKMTYEAHENPIWYNVVTVVAGYVPYTLLLLVSLFFLRYHALGGGERLMAFPLLGLYPPYGRYPSLFTVVHRGYFRVLLHSQKQA